jgi:hypothetical protein
MQVPDSLLGGQVRCPTCRIVFGCTADGAAIANPISEPPPSEATGSASTDASEPPIDAKVIQDPTGEFMACPICAEMIPGHALTCPFCKEPIDHRGRWMRRDVVPHRGGLILVLGIVSLVSVVGVVFCLAFNLVGIGLGVAAWVMGNKDLAQIYRGEMDPDGQSQTKSGRNCGIIGMVLNIVLLLACAGFFTVLFLAQRPPGRW